jgi:hypothetical protein
MSLTGAAFLLVYLALLTLAVVRDARFGLYTYLALVYLHPPSRWWGEMLPDLRWALVAAVVTLLATLRLPPDKTLPSWHHSTPARLLIVFTIWIWIQNLWALARPEHLDLSILFTKYLVLIYLIHRLVTTQREVGNFLLAHVIGCAYLGWLTLSAPAAGRLEGVGGPGIDEANALGMFVATGAICAGVLILAERGWRRWVCVLALPLLGNTLVQSESRSATLGLLAGGLTLLLLLPKGYRLKSFAAGVAGLVVLAAMAPPVYWERLTTMKAAVNEEIEMDTSAESRMVIIEAQWRMWQAYPMGSGHRGTAVLSPLYLDEAWLTRSHPDDTAARSSHNTMMSALAEQGVVGFVVFSWFGLWLLGSVLAVRRLTAAGGSVDARFALYAAGAAGSLAVVFTAGLFVDYLKTEVQIWMFVLLATLLTVRRLQLKSKAEALESAHGVSASDAAKVHRPGYP